MNDQEARALTAAINSTVVELHEVHKELKQLREQREKNFATKEDLKNAEGRIIEHFDKQALTRDQVVKLTQRLGASSDALAATVAANQPAADSGSPAG